MSNSYVLRRIKSGLFFLLLALLFGIFAVALRHIDIHTENSRFEKLTNRIFRSELASSSLDLHYFLAMPDKQGIKIRKISFGSPTQERPLSASYEKAVENFSPELLNEQNRRLQKVLRYYLEAQKELGDAKLCAEPLSPSLGVQAQLPVLLAEYSFRSKQDILDYLGLLKALPTYFKELLTLEQEKAQNGLFMNDACADGIIAQCNSFIENPDNNYLDTVFSEKINAFETLSPKERNALLQLHQKLLRQSVIPAYQTLADGLSALKGSGKNPYGLCYFSNGKAYYSYLLKTTVGTLDSPDEIRNRLLQQLFADSREIRTLLQNNPDLHSISEQGAYFSKKPPLLLEDLQQKMKNDFPALNSVDYEVKQIHKDLAPFLSPAFYLTPPVDTNSPNLIYLNPTSGLSGIELFTTLAHEGFPGHLYQTVFFSRTKPPLLRYLFSPAGYIEGWATYIERYAYAYSGFSEEQAQLLWLNRSVTLCLYSLLDLGIHYYGWKPADALRFLTPFGISEAGAVSRIYQYIVETPANYLKYYFGCLCFQDLEASARKDNPDFQLKAFHQKLLTLGPLPFALLQKELGSI